MWHLINNSNFHCNEALLLAVHAVCSITVAEIVESKSYEKNREIDHSKISPQKKSAGKLTKYLRSF